MHPDKIDLDLLFERGSLAYLVSSCLDFLKKHDLVVSEWKIPRTAKAKRDLSLLDKKLGSEEIESARIIFSNGAQIAFSPQGEEWRARFHWLFPNQSHDDVVWFMRTGFELICGRGEQIRIARMRRTGGGLDALPEVPLIGSGHLAMVTDEDVASHYDRPEAFWELDWQFKKTFGPRTLVARSLDKADSCDVLRDILPGQGRLARAAAPGKTKWVPPQIVEDEREILLSEPRTLNPVGYLPESKTIEYSSDQAAGVSIPIWEIYTLKKLIDGKVEGSGRPVETVRVVFMYRKSAMAQKRPLLDIGAEVHFYNKQGELEQVTE